MLFWGLDIYYCVLQRIVIFTSQKWINVPEGLTIVVYRGSE